MPPRKNRGAGGYEDYDDYEDYDGYEDYRNHDEQRWQPTQKKKTDRSKKLPSPPQPKIERPKEIMSKKKEDDVVGQNCTNVIFVGHVDSGKSTLVGHLLHELGEVATQDIERLEKMARQLGKPSFAFAWVMDQGEDERNRGITMDVTYRHFRSPDSKRLFNFLDAPGHAEFVPGVVKGSAYADAAVLLIDGVKFMKGAKKEGQTLEHLRILSALHVKNVVVAINKMDQLSYSQESYTLISKRVEKILALRNSGPKDMNVQIVPISAYHGVNLTSKNPNIPAELANWFSGGSFFAALDNIPTPERMTTDLDASIFSIIESLPSSSKFKCFGRVEKGSFRCGTKIPLHAYPDQEFHLTEIECFDSLVTRVDAGTICTFTVKPLATGTDLRPGMCFFSPVESVVFGTKFSANVNVFDSDNPLYIGKQVICFIKSYEGSATITQIMDVKNNSINLLATKGKISFELSLESWIQKGHVVIIRDEGKTVAVGEFI